MLLDGEQILKLVKDAQDGNQDAKAKLLEENSPLIKSVIKRFKDKAKTILGLNDISSRELLEKIKQENDNLELRTAIDEFIDYMIIGLSNIIDIFEPEAICIGGSFVFFKEIFYSKLVKQMNARKYVFNKEKMPQILLAELGNDAGMIGATI